MEQDVTTEMFESELSTAFTIDQVEQRLEMEFHCCTGGNFGISNNDSFCCGFY